MSLGGSVPIRNGINLDYCFREAIKSLLPICDQIIVCDSDSSDGTREFIEAWSKSEPKITICNFPWTDPVGTNEFFCEWLNYARQHLSTTHFIHLDGDEVLFEEDYELVRNAHDAKATLYCKRLNFWKDAQHLIPEGHCCGTKVLRIAPTNMPIPSDYPWAPAADTMKQAVDSNIRIGHYGFLRHRENFFRKARVVQKMWTNSFDPRLEIAERFEGNWMESPGVTGWENNLVDYNGTHPSVIHQWLRERGNAI